MGIVGRIKVKSVSNYKPKTKQNIQFKMLRLNDDFNLEVRLKRSNCFFIHAALNVVAKKTKNKDFKLQGHTHTHTVKPGRRRH